MIYRTVYCPSTVVYSNCLFVPLVNSNKINCPGFVPLANSNEKFIPLVDNSAIYFPSS